MKCFSISRKFWSQISPPCKRNLDSCQNVGPLSVVKLGKGGKHCCGFVLRCVCVCMHKHIFFYFLLHERQRKNTRTRKIIIHTVNLVQDRMLISRRPVPRSGAMWSSHRLFVRSGQMLGSYLLLVDHGIVSQIRKHISLCLLWTSYYKTKLKIH